MARYHLLVFMWMAAGLLMADIGLGGPKDEPIPRVGQANVAPPVFTKRVSPVYPERALAIKLQGYVILEAILREDGVIEDIKVLRGLGKGKFGFEKAAIEALKQWEFLPGKVDGMLSDVRMTLKIDFVIEEKHNPVALLDWRVDDERVEGYTTPGVLVNDDYETILETKSNMSLPIRVWVDNRGKVVDYEIHQKSLDRMGDSAIIHENMEHVFPYYTWKLAKYEGIGVATEFYLEIPVPLEPMQEK